MKKVFVLLMVGFLLPVVVFAESLPDHTGVSAVTNGRHSDYGPAEVTRHGAAINYQNGAIGLSASASTGIARLKEFGVRTEETLYFGVSIAYRVFRVGPVDVGLTSEISAMPSRDSVELKDLIIAPGVSATLRRGTVVEVNNGIIFQVKPTKDLALYGGPAFLLFRDTGSNIDEHGLGGFAGMKYEMTKKVTLGAEVTGADRLHVAGSVAYHF